MNLPDRLREASHYALMDAARPLLREAAKELERTLWRARIQKNIISRLKAELEKR